jgi:hypothetical protein
MRKLFFVAIALLLFAVPCITAEVSLAWDASATPTVTGYKIYVGEAPRTYGAPIVIGNQLTYTVGGLSAGMKYFAATAFDADGNESDYSNEVSKLLTAGTLPVTIQITEIPSPGPRVTLLLVPNISTTQATIVWQTDVDCSGTALWSTDQLTWKSVKANNLGTTEHLSVIGPLISRTHYFYKVTGDCNGQIIESQIRSFNSK